MPNSSSTPPENPPITDLSSSTMDDPYFLHHSDGPGLVLVSQILTGENYASWSRAMFIALSVKNKLDFIDGLLPKPNSTDQVRYKAWIRNNNVVISWILNFVSKDIYASIIYLESAAHIWKELKERFRQSNGPRIFQIKRDLTNTSQGTDSVSTYFTKLKVLWEEIANYSAHCTCGRCTCGGAKEVELTMSFLMGLNDSYSNIRGQLLLMDPIPFVNRFFSLVIQEERQRTAESSSTVNSNSSSSLAFNVRSNVNSNKPYNSISQNKLSLNKFQSIFCTHCNKNGHTKDCCYRLHGFPPGFKFNNPKSNDTRANSVSHIQSTDSLTADFSTPVDTTVTEATTGLTDIQ